MLERVVYFSGPSGNGKTTLIRELLRRNADFVAGNPEKLDREQHVRDKRRKFPSYAEYLKAKIDERYAHAVHHAELERRNPGCVILADILFCLKNIDNFDRFLGNVVYTAIYIILAR